MLLVANGASSIVAVRKKDGGKCRRHFENARAAISALLHVLLLIHLHIRTPQLSAAKFT